jgi:branched-subunit amino acid ABC-type transport system permease component
VAHGGRAATLYMMRIGSTRQNAGFILGVKAFTAAVMGGIGNLRGALLGGPVLGSRRTGAPRLRHAVEGRRVVRPAGR